MGRCWWGGGLVVVEVEDEVGSSRVVERDGDWLGVWILCFGKVILLVHWRRYTPCEFPGEKTRRIRRK